MPKQNPSKSTSEIEGRNENGNDASLTQGGVSGLRVMESDDKDGLTLKINKGSLRPQLQEHASTAVSLADVYNQPLGEASPPPRPSRSRAASTLQAISYPGRISSRRGSDADESASIRSIQSHVLDRGEVESLLGDDANVSFVSIDPDNDGENARTASLFPTIDTEDFQFQELFEHEFDELEELAGDGSNEESLVIRWRCKLKHFLILSSAGKPIYSRHGDDQLISNSIGVVQTIISFFLEGKDNLRSLTAGNTRFAVLSKGHLHLVAISQLGESDGQLRTQLEALYMQILSALTLPNMQRMFMNRPSTDLRRPLEGNAPLLSALADDFTRGSPSTLLSALECLKMRKTQREVVNQTMVKCKVPSLLYGLIAAGGRLVSVIRPKKHSLHPGDLQLIFNMLFKAGGIRAAGGENWIPLCLPAFNNTGYIYMHVSFLEQASQRRHKVGHDQLSSSDSSGRDDDIVIVLISPSKDSFDEMRQMRDNLVEQLEGNGSMAIIRSSVSSGRPRCNDIVPSTPVRHFLYKSRANVQFVMPTVDPMLQSAFAWRRLMSLYSSLHSAVHGGKTSHLKIHHVSSERYVSLAWVTPTFELYCIADPNVSREALAHGASRLEQWARKEQERLFIIGGAVF